MDAFVAVLRDNWKIIAIATGPLTASMLARVFLGKSKLVQMCVHGSSAWLAIRTLIGPMMAMAQSNVHYLNEITRR